MRCIVHISDLHFGRITPLVLPALATTIAASKPDLIVVSGDLTQRAKDSEFALAKEFLDTLPKPQIVVPGNHDVPLYNVVLRWLAPLQRYRRYFGDDLQPFYRDEELAVVGINTARSLTFKNGRINAAQVEQACRCLVDLPGDPLRIVVTHHPFGLAEVGSSDLVGRADMAMAKFAQCGVDVVLSGHMHASDTLSSTDLYPALNRSCLFIQAGTASSSRRREETNAFNILRIDKERLTVTRVLWSEPSGVFESGAEETFERRAGGWKIAPL